MQRAPQAELRLLDESLLACLKWLAIAHEQCYHRVIALIITEPATKRHTHAQAYGLAATVVLVSWVLSCCVINCQAATPAICKVKCAPCIRRS